MTFCRAKCKTLNCPRNFTDEIQLDAREWWGGDNAPVAFMDMSKTCEEYKEVGK